MAQDHRCHDYVFQAFGFDPNLSRIRLLHGGTYPVYFVPHDGIDRLQGGSQATLAASPSGFVVKKTPMQLSRCQALQAWLTLLNKHQVYSVIAVTGFESNPREIIAPDGRTEVWVVYPYIKPHPLLGVYNATDMQISLLGDHLGRMHAIDPSEMPPSFQGFVVSGQEVATLRQLFEVDSSNLEKYARLLREEIGRWYGNEALRDSGVRWIAHLDGMKARLEKACSRIFEAEERGILAICGCCRDYSADNVILHGRGDSAVVPVLIDPDRGGRTVRVFDLALAILVLHRRNPATPRLLTETQWQVFYSAYARHVCLSDHERILWDDAALLAWFSYAVWAVGNYAKRVNDPKENTEEHEHEFYESLMNFSVATFPIFPPVTGEA